MANFLAASGIIFIVLAGWLYVEEIYRRFSRRHPELGPFRQEEGGGCGDGCCSCKGGSCPAPRDAPSTTAVHGPSTRSDTHA